MGKQTTINRVKQFYETVRKGMHLSDAQVVAIAEHHSASGVSPYQRQILQNQIDGDPSLRFEILGHK